MADVWSPRAPSVVIFPGLLPCTILYSWKTADISLNSRNFEFEKAIASFWVTCSNTIQRNVHSVMYLNMHAINNIRLLTQFLNVMCLNMHAIPIRIHVPRLYELRFRGFVKQCPKQKEKHFQHSFVPVKIFERLSTRSVPLHLRLYATTLLMSSFRPPFRFPVHTHTESMHPTLTPHDTGLHILHVKHHFTQAMDRSLNKPEVPYVKMAGKRLSGTTYSGAVSMWSPAVAPKGAQQSAYFDVRMTLVAQSISVLERGILCVKRKLCDLLQQCHEFAALRHYLKRRYFKLRASFLRRKVRIREYFSVVPSVIACVLPQNGWCWKAYSCHIDIPG